MNKNPVDTYRPDIDGLRAIAVTSVVFYHAFIPGFQGGFTGVDVFFVISGYLITSILLKELDKTGSISIVNFYARRIKRIFPSLLLVCLFVLVFSILFLSASLFEIHKISKSIVATMFFISNIYFMMTNSGYFASTADEIPLLHTWSLAVEEQYYIIWPLFVLIFTNFSRKYLSFVVYVLLLLSIALSLILQNISGELAFYFPLSRFWEIGIGSLLAIFVRRENSYSSSVVASLSSTVGVVLIVLGILFVSDSSNKFPVPSAFLPTLGTCMVIWGGNYSKDSFVVGVLSTKVFRFVGRISYAWYLWHWPLLSFAYILTLGHVANSTRLLLVAISFLLASATTLFFEEPIRFRTKSSHSLRTIGVGIVGALSVVVLSTTAYIGARQGWIEGDERIKTAYLDRPPRQDACLNRSAQTNIEQLAPASCISTEPNKSIVIWGDSFGGHWEPSVNKVADENGLTVTLLTKSACPPLINVTPLNGKYRKSYSDCTTFNDRVIDWLEGSEHRPKAIILAANWADRADSDAGTYFNVSDQNVDDAIKSLEEHLRETLDVLSQLGLNVLVMKQSPKLSSSAPVCVMRVDPSLCFVTETEHEQRAGQVNTSIEKIVSEFVNASTIDPSKILCADKICPAMLDDYIVYYDNQHVSASFSASNRSVSIFKEALDPMLMQKTSRSE